MEGISTKNLDGNLMYNLREAGIHVGRTSETIRCWLKINEALINAGKPAIIPTPVVLDGAMHYSQSDITSLKLFMRMNKKGDLKRIQKELNTILKS